MPSSEQKASLLATFVVVSLLFVAPGCKGFFVNQPTSVTVSPNAPPLLGSGGTQKFTALAAYQSGSSKDVTTSATWSSSNPCAVAVIASGSNAGNATAVGTGGAVTITANLSGITGTATATVATGITISPCPETAVGTLTEVLFHTGGNQAFTATSGGTDVTSSATWISNNPSVVNFASSSSSTATFPSAGTTTIMANASSATGTLLITVQ